MDKRLAEIDERFPFIRKWEKDVMHGTDFSLSRVLKDASETEPPFDATYYREGETGEYIENGWHTVRGTRNIRALEEMGVTIPENFQTRINLENMAKENNRMAVQLDGVIGFTDSCTAIRKVAALMKSVAITIPDSRITAATLGYNV